MMDEQLEKDVAIVTEARHWIVKFFLGHRLDGIDKDRLYELRDELKGVELRMEQRKETENV